VRSAVDDQQHVGVAPLRAAPDDIVERLTDATSVLARRNAALEDFAALVAHELKTPLQAALVTDDPTDEIHHALELVDSLLQAARREGAGPALASPAAVLDEVVSDLDPQGLHVVAELPGSFPLPEDALRVILRNLVRNAVAAGAHEVRVSADECSGRWMLAVDDDGVGLDDAEGYSPGSGVGLSLSRRLADRFGGVLELVPRAEGGTRARLELGVAA
jgi:signal transduction histidine kinase